MDQVKQYNHLHKVGEIVRVYDDPISKRKLDGSAKITKLLTLDHYYEVQFVDDPSYRGCTFSRFIY
jgi:hypothetical protein